MSHAQDNHRRPAFGRYPEFKLRRDRRYRKLRRLVLSEEPLCRACKERGYTRAAVQVDHIVPLRQRPDLLLERTNLQPLCRACHHRKTRYERTGQMGCDEHGNLQK